MSVTLAQFNTMNQAEANSVLMTCCTSSQWAKELAALRPFATISKLVESSDTVWNEVKQQEAHLLEAFDGHPQIGNVATLKEKYRNTKTARLMSKLELTMLRIKS